MGKEKTYNQTETTLAHQKGITLIALIITIIVLIILAGVTINLILGENGIFNVAEKSVEEYTKAALEEELKTAIFEIQSKKIAEGLEMKRENLSELSSISAYMKSYGIPALGEYKDYAFEVDENYNITIGSKLNGEKPIVEATILSTKSKGIIEIQVTASIKEGTIKNIEATNGAILKNSLENTDTKKIFTVTKNGTYYFKAISDNGRVNVTEIEVNEFKQVQYLFKEGVGKENWDFVSGGGTILEKRDNCIYMRGASIYGDNESGKAIAYFKEKIDLTGYSKLYVELQGTHSTGSMNHNSGFVGVTDSPSSQYRNKKAGTYNEIRTTDGRVVCEYIIKEGFEAYAPCVWVSNSNSGTSSEIIVYNVWLEP